MAVNRRVVSPVCVLLRFAGLIALDECTPLYDRSFLDRPQPTVYSRGQRKTPLHSILGVYHHPLLCLTQLKDNSLHVGLNSLLFPYDDWNLIRADGRTRALRRNQTQEACTVSTTRNILNRCLVKSELLNPRALPQHLGVPAGSHRLIGLKHGARC